ncbi:T9SS type A sorting domain-containing protein [Flavobacterium ovatum]|uniref:T9SS type A sorting domain-containing protein n=1 Tax=Flavobacterium ovatum TaxID=1928857 RepID=UPI00344B1D67
MKLNVMRYLILLFYSSFYGQQLHHQMLSSQGSTTTLSNGMIVKQTIGQQTVSGTSKKEYVVLQGFQQGYWSKLISSSINKNNIIVRTYPNPFVDLVHLQLSKKIDEEVTVSIFDTSGHLIFQVKKKPIDMIVTLNLDFLPGSVFLVRLDNSQLNYFTKILKAQ